MLFRSNHFKDGTKYGVSCENPQFNLEKILQRKTKIIRKLTAGVRSYLSEAGVTVVAGEAFVEKYEKDNISVRSGEESFSAKNLILATGSEVSVPPVPGLDKVRYMTSDEALSPQAIPETMVIIGAGVIGIEFAFFYSSMGAKVTVIDVMPEILSNLDSEIAITARGLLTKKGITFCLGAEISAIGEGKVTLRNQDGAQEIGFDALLVASGRKPVLKNIDLNIVPLEFNGKNIAVNQFMQSSLEGVYACGDIIGKSMLAHSAEREGEVAVNHILGIEDKMNYKVVPSVVYTDPEITSVGYTEDQLKASQTPYTLHKRYMTYSGRFVVENEGENGLCKILVAEDDKLLGAHFIGNPSSEFITIITMAIEEQITYSQVKRIIFPHPTVSEIIK